MVRWLTFCLLEGDLDSGHLTSKRRIPTQLVLLSRSMGPRRWRGCQAWQGASSLPHSCARQRCRWEWLNPPANQAAPGPVAESDILEKESLYLHQYWLRLESTRCVLLYLTLWEEKSLGLLTCLYKSRLNQLEPKFFLEIESDWSSSHQHWSLNGPSPVGSKSWSHIVTSKQDTVHYCFEWERSLLVYIPSIDPSALHSWSIWVIPQSWCPCRL